MCPRHTPLLALALIVFLVGADAKLVIKNAERNVDVSTQVLKEDIKLTFENVGGEAQDFFTHVVETNREPQLAWISASELSGNDQSKKTPLTVIRGDFSPKGRLWKILLSSAVGEKETREVELSLVFTHSLEPFPSKITQNQPQLVRYTGNAHGFLAYEARSVKTTVTLSSNNIESYTKIKPVSTTDATVTYGPYENLPPFSEAEVVIHYENNAPFLTVTSLQRWIEISHWGGNIAVEEDVDVEHSGARLKGPFSRHEFQRGQSGPSSVSAYRTFLPAAASSVYYRDDIGNISTSQMRVMDDAVEIELRPRFPLFGGWRTKYKIGYNVPSYEYLYSKGDRFVLEMRFVDHIFDDVVMDHAVVSVVLPEGAEDVQVSFPDYPRVKRLPDRILKTYLDTTGRIVVSAEKRNLVENHIQDMQIRYKLPAWRLLMEPLLVVVAFYLLFVLIIVYVRLDFSISKDESSEARMKAAGIMESVVSGQEKRDEIYSGFDSAIAALKSSKDNGAFQSTLKSLNSDHKNVTQAIADQVTRLRSLSSGDMAERVSELQKLDRAMKDVIGQQVQLVERLVAAKVNRAVYLTEEAQCAKKREELADRIQALTAAL